MVTPTAVPSFTVILFTSDPVSSSTSKLLADDSSADTSFSVPPSMKFTCRTDPPVPIWLWRKTNAVPTAMGPWFMCRIPAAARVPRSGSDSNHSSSSSSILMGRIRSSSTSAFRPCFRYGASMGFMDRKVERSRSGIGSGVIP